MPRLLNSPFYYGQLDAITGETFDMKVTTTWADGGPMSDGRVDNVFYFKNGTDYYKRVGPLRVDVRSLGLIGDGVFRNELVLAKAMRKLPPFTEYYFPEGTFLFGPLPSDYNNLGGTPVAINWGNTGATFTGLSNTATTLQFLPGCVGIQINGGLVKGVPALRHFSMQGPGQDVGPDGRVTNTGATMPDGNANPDAGRTLGDWSLNPNAYQYSGINAWAQVLVENVDVRGFGGHGLWTQGYIGLHAKGLPSNMSGTFINSVTFRLDDVAQSGSFGFGTKVQLGTAKGFVGGHMPNGDLVFDTSQDGNISFPSTGQYTVTLYVIGSDLIADNGVISGNCNFDFNGGCGIYIQGSDGNQWNVFGCSVRENGLWGIWDRSFLGNFFYGTHGSHNGNHINKFGIGGIVHNDLLVVGAFQTTDVNAHSGWFGCYTEEGNQGPSYFATNAVVIGGIHAAGITGPGFRQDGPVANHLSIGEILLNSSPAEMQLTYGGSGVMPLRLKRYGQNGGVYGFGYGDAAAGQGVHALMTMPMDGALLDNDRGGTRPAPLHGLACITSYLGLTKTTTWTTITAYLQTGPTGDAVGDYLVVDNTSGPRRYRCLVGGPTPVYAPDDAGSGLLSARPTNLTTNDTSWVYYATDTNTQATWTGTAWQEGSNSLITGLTATQTAQGTSIATNTQNITANTVAIAANTAALPGKFTNRGTFAANTAYAINDVIVQAGNAYFRQLGAFTPTAFVLGDWVAFSTPQFTSAQVATVLARSSAISVLTMSGPVGYDTLDAALASTARGQSYSAILNAANFTVTTTNNTAYPAWPAFFDGRGASVIVNDGVTLTVSGGNSATCTITNVFFNGPTATPTSTIVIPFGGYQSSLAGQAAQLIGCFSNIPIQLTGSGLVTFTNGYYKSLTGIGTVYLYGTVQVDSIASTLTVIDRRPGATSSSTSPATATTAGVVKIGNGITVTPDGTISAATSSGDTYSVLPYAPSIALDFNAASVRTLAATGNVAFAASVNVALLKTAERYITNTTGAAITLSFPSGWTFFPGPAPTSLAAGKQAVLTVRSLGTDDSTVKAAYVAQA